MVKVEYIAARVCCAQILYMKSSLLDFVESTSTLDTLIDKEAESQVPLSPHLIALSWKRGIGGRTR